MNAVTTCSTANDHHKIAGLGMLEAFLTRNQPDIAAEHQRIRQVTIIKIQRPVDRRYPHPVTIVPHTGDHALHDPPRVQHALRHIFQLHVRPGKAENIRIRHRLGAHARPHRVADHTTDTCRRSAVRVQR